MAFRPLPTTFVIALAIELKPAERMAQQGLGRIWLFEDCGISSNRVSNTTASRRFLPPRQRLTFLAVFARNSVFIYPLKDKRGFLGKIRQKIFACLVHPLQWLIF